MMKRLTALLLATILVLSLCAGALGETAVFKEINQEPSQTKKNETADSEE